jgi:hypothetical protein
LPPALALKDTLLAQTRKFEPPQGQRGSAQLALNDAKRTARKWGETVQALRL